MRISKTALYGVSVDEEFKRARASILPSTISLPGSVFHTYTMVDTGCEGQSFIDLEWTEEKKIPLLPLRNPFQLVGYDGVLNENRTVRHYVRVDFQIGDHTEKDMILFVTPLAHYHTILGLPWLEKHDPKTEWASRTITFNSKFCREHCGISEQPQPQPMLKDIPKKTAPRYLPDRPEGLQNTDIAFISVNFVRQLQRRNTDMFIATIDDIDHVIRQKQAIQVNGIHESSDGTESDIIQNLPIEIQDYAEVFSPKKADQLPRHRSYDHNIQLLPGKDLPFGPLYSMSRTELEALKEWLDENLKKGFIRPSSSAAASPVLFVKKPGGGLRLCIDFRAINNISVKDRYPLPLIKETLNNLQGMKYFSKIDIISAFNNVRMKEGQEHLTAFRTRFGLFESLVMPFRLTGAPATF